jgi:hypothetical protein
VLGLAFGDELLVFDPQEHLAVRPGNTMGALLAQRDSTLLLRALLLNGKLEITITESGRRLGRTDAYIGQNIDFNGSLRNLDRMLADNAAAVSALEANAMDGIDDATRTGDHRPDDE